jgi:tRNA/rRNA methyltransferase
VQRVDVIVILVEPEFESTIGFLARVMKNFGMTELRLVNPFARIGNDAHMWASHAQEVLDSVKIFADLETALDGVNLSVGTTAQRASSVFRIVRKPVTPSELVHVLAGVTGKLAIVFGREGTGLKNEELQMCELTLTIQASPQYPTLNVSHAAAIIFHELYTATSRSSYVDILASDLVKGRILESIQWTSDRIGLPLRNRTLVVKAFKSTMGRAGLRAREASLLAGFFRRIQSQMSEGRAAEGK